MLDPVGFVGTDIIKKFHCQEHFFKKKAAPNKKHSGLLCLDDLTLKIYT
jgi:hypothetical protein